MSSTMIVEVCDIKEVISHDNSDNLELAIVKGWQVVIGKGQYKEGDKVIFIPPDALLPIELADSLGVRNYLSGSNKDRVRCVRLRGEMSFGLVIDIPQDKDWEIGYNCCEELGIVKYIPPVRANAGDAAPEDPYFSKYTNIENIRNFPNVFEEGEMVVVTEKCDGSNLRTGISATITEDGETIYEWKAGSHKVKRKMPEENIEKNTYWFVYNILKVRQMVETLHSSYKEVILYGEVYGAVRGGHKSLHYGKPGSLEFVAFDIQCDGEYMDWDNFEHICNTFKVPTVPLIGIFKYNFEDMKKLSKGESILAMRNGAKHMREGIVIKPLKERNQCSVGRLALKMLNDDYLVLKNKASDKGEITDFTDE